MLCQFIRGKFPAALALFALTPSLTFADTIGAGYGVDATQTLPAITTLAAYDTLSNGNRVVYDGSQIWIETDAGAVVQVLGNPNPNSFASFIEVDPTETFALLGENNMGNIYKVSLTTGNPTLLATLAYNFDLVYESSTSALVSAAATSFAFNDIYRLDITTGATTLIATAQGPSGPLALSPAGDLYYATQSGTFPTPPGSTDIIRWTAGQITNGPFPLPQSRATVFTPGLDGGASMVFDTAFGNLFVSESVYGGTSAVVEIDRTGAIVGDAVTSLDTLGRIEIVDTAGDGACAAFQPAGRALKYRTTDFISFSSKVTTLSPRRPILTSVQNGDNTMTCTLTGGAPNSSAFVISGTVAMYNPSELSYDLATHLFWTGMPFNNIRRAGIQFATDATGTGSFTFSNPPSSQGLFVIQALVRNSLGVYRGTSTAAFN
ncbi:MAG: hypothetical protein JNL28_16845 [Planctomycetes bacterium]|nr:hypothetical protein [Planctomycetota bacterium]